MAPLLDGDVHQFLLILSLHTYTLYFVTHTVCVISADMHYNLTVLTITLCLLLHIGVGFTCLKIHLSTLRVGF